MSRSPGLAEGFDRLPVAARDERSYRDQGPPPFVLGRRQNVKDQALDHGPGGFVPERVVALVNDDDGIGDPPRLVDGLFVISAQAHRAD